jgi:hypothetical protein
MSNDDPYAHLKQHALTPERMKELATIRATKVSVSRKERKRREQFVMVPFSWIEKLDGATGQTYRVALLLLHEHWRRRGQPIRVNNCMVVNVGISRQSKWRALSELERHGLITVERRPRKSPVVRVLGC